MSAEIKKLHRYPLKDENNELVRPSQSERSRALAPSTIEQLSQSTVNLSSRLPLGQLTHLI